MGSAHESDRQPRERHHLRRRRPIMTLALCSHHPPSVERERAEARGEGFDLLRDALDVDPPATKPSSHRMGSAHEGWKPIARPTQGAMCSHHPPSVERERAGAPGGGLGLLRDALDVDPPPRNRESGSTGPNHRLAPAHDGWKTIATLTRARRRRGRRARTTRPAQNANERRLRTTGLGCCATRSMLDPPPTEPPDRVIDSHPRMRDGNDRDAHAGSDAYAGNVLAPPAQRRTRTSGGSGRRAWVAA